MKKLMAANWKMYKTIDEAVAFIEQIAPLAEKPAAAPWIGLGVAVLLIVAAMLFVQRVDGSVTDWVSVAVGFALVLLSLWVAMRFAGVVMKVLGESGTILVTRIAGLLLAAIAVQLVADAVIAFVQTA